MELSLFASSDDIFYKLDYEMSASSDRVTRSQSKEELRPDATTGPKTNSQASDSDFGDSPPVNEGNTGNQKQAVDKIATEQTTETSVPSPEKIREELINLVTKHRKGLENIYGTGTELDTNLEKPIKRGEDMAKKLIDMGCGGEVAKQLTVLTLYDVALLIGMC